MGATGYRRKKTASWAADGRAKAPDERGASQVPVIGGTKVRSTRPEEFRPSAGFTAGRGTRLPRVTVAPKRSLRGSRECKSTQDAKIPSIRKYTPKRYDNASPYRLFGLIWATFLSAGHVLPLGQKPRPQPFVPSGEHATIPSTAPPLRLFGPPAVVAYYESDQCPIHGILRPG